MDRQLPRSTVLNRYWPFIKWASFAVIVLFIARRGVHLWIAAPPESVEINWFWLIPAGLVYFIGWLPSVWFWRELLSDLRQPIGRWVSSRAYFISHLGKYVPGKALVIIIRASMAKDAGVNPLIAGVTAIYETLVFMATGAALALAFSPAAFGETIWSHFPPPFSRLREYPVLVGLFVALATFVSTPISAWLFTKICRKTLPHDVSKDRIAPAISARLISQGVAITSLGWACHALSLGFVLQSISSHPFDIGKFPMWMAACTISTVGGFVVLIAPGGIGIREGILIEALKDQPLIGPKMALVTACLLRTIWFATELIAAGILLVLRAKRTPVDVQSSGSVDSQ